MSDIFREVDEELRRDRLQVLWKKYGWYAVGGAVAIVVAVAAERGYRAWVDAQSGESGAKLSRAIELAGANDVDKAMPLLQELQSDGYGNYKLLAKMQRAAALAESGDRDGAVALYDEVAGDPDVDEMLRGVARIRAALLLVDTASAEEIDRRVGDLARDDSGTWRHTARELLALSAYRRGEHAAADEQYDRIMTDPATPAGLRGRAEMMRALIAPHLAGAGQ